MVIDCLSLGESYVNIKVVMFFYVSMSHILTYDTILMKCYAACLDVYTLMLYLHDSQTPLYLLQNIFFNTEASATKSVTQTIV